MTSARRAAAPRHNIVLTASALLAVIFAISPAAAQTPNDDFARRQAQEAEQQRLETLGRMTPKPAQTEAQQPAASGGQKAGPCFAITHVEVEGVKQFSATAIDTVTAPYANRCVGVGEINSLLRDLTHLYLNKGFVTSRVYVPAQDIAGTKVLRLVAVEGTLSDIYINGMPAPGSGMLATAFPGMKGEITNLRDIEQGLDQINRLSSNNAKTAMLPGKTDGTSILNIENKPDHPWHLSFGNSNLGQEQTGYSKSSASVGYDNLFGINDQWNFSYEHSGPDYPWRDDGVGKSNSYSGNVSVPYGYWTLSLNGSWYGYDSSVPGNFGTLQTSGDSKQVGIGADRVLFRDKDSITTLNTGLTYKETNNFLLGSKIEVGSRKYTAGDLGISHSRRMLGGLWVFDLSYSQGLNLFDAVAPGDAGAGDADPRFSKFSGTITVTRPFELAEQRFELNSIVTGQYSPDNLFGAEQISLGGYSSVRGTRETMLYGNNGFFVRNDLVWRTQPFADNAELAKILGEFRPYVGLDYGRIARQARYRIDGGDMLGWTAGAKLAGGHVNFDIGYSDIFGGTTDRRDAGLLFVSTSVKW
ncbi:ShlB/FhaC/HecB family hemolysin secretion/activation protein [Rhizobium rhizogenes]|uniref:ShlB/FhaC/HecB family hemolysin secretion/activation protein n=5 Tax=Rhizobium rhizogenes TaxID=359 RepID=UPI00157304E7|nr:ShlB/FhaC/HecB family hemolysin secretion/activation protein [Rhizobium rhizogenes]NTF46679.1 ShlB/FhaC/HecB family hemolysin secretion/activation protein [Rhizobium rhizogenes]NTF53273.1 ShlB/FhaC/HecB family hemolysin secretion/activation protein [Rhizobium rhizogenes]NTF72854.1 ShlB/FhaC/HecB family hemolysin secretion/activation protein [Rhizobium rhizogenes]NTG25542.1 ShlB/FhaC/HecB family hemolysin secretion/activation protein [Rhizobium rhizogenes]NTH04158.1 ShlB/FhaC/HecB family hem